MIRGLQERLLGLVIVLLGLYAGAFFYLASYSLPRANLGFRVQFFKNTELAGEPADTWQDDIIDFNESGHKGLFRATNYSIRWLAYLPVATAKTYEFSLISNHGSRLKVDGETVIDFWFDHPEQEKQGQILLTAGWHEIAVEYYHRIGAVSINANMGQLDRTMEVLGRTPINSVPETMPAKHWLWRLRVSNMVRTLLSPLFLAFLLAASWMALQHFTPATSVQDRRSLLLLMMVFGVTMALFFYPVIYSTAYHNFVYLRSLVIDHDLNFINDYRIHTDYIRIPPIELDELHAYDNHTIANPEGIGAALLMSPGFLIGHLLARWLMLLFSSPAADGATMVEISAMLYSSALLSFLGLLICYWIVRRMHRVTVTVGAISVLWFGMLAFYMYKAAGFSQNAQVFVASLFVYEWLQEYGFRSRSSWLKLGFLAAILLWTGFNSFSYLLLPLGEWAASIRKLKPAGSYGNLVWFVLIVMAAIGLQLSLWSHVHHLVPSLTIQTYSPPRIVDLLFGPRYSLLMWFPAGFGAVVGLIMKQGARPRLENALLLGVVILAILHASQIPVQGLVFGAQPLVALFPIFCIGLAHFLERLGKKGVIRAFLWLSVVWFGFVYTAFEHNFIRDHRLSYTDFFDRVGQMTPLKVVQSWTNSLFIYRTEICLAGDRYKELLFMHAFCVLMAAIMVGSLVALLRWLRKTNGLVGEKP